jgi:hypothetical protein
VNITPLKRWTIGFAAASLIWAAILGLDLAPWLRGDFGWRWPYAFPPLHPERLLLLGIVLAGYCFAAFWLLRSGSQRWLPLWAFIGTIALAVSVLYVTTDNPQYELFTRTVSSLTTGWHYAAAEIDDRGGLFPVLRTWPDFIATFKDSASHVSTSPPGLPIAYYLLNKLLGLASGLSGWLAGPLRAAQCQNIHLMYYSDAELASAWSGILLPLWAAFIVFPLYALGKRHFNLQVANFSVIWWPLVPSLLMFLPHPGILYAMGSLIVIGLLIDGIQDNQLFKVLLSGIVLSVLTFLSFSVLPLIFMAGCVVLLFFITRRASSGLQWGWPFKIGALFGIGLLSIWLIYFLVSGIRVDQIIRVSLQNHLILDRPYLPWLLLHLNDFFMFTGWPLILLMGLSLWNWLRPAARTSLSSGMIIGISAAITVIVLDISGSTQGEAGRIWVFFVPFLLLGAAANFADSDDTFSPVVITASQAAMLLAMVAFVHVIDSGLPQPPASPPPTVISASTPYLPGGALFDHTLRLRNFTGYIDPNSGQPYGSLRIWLEWESSGQVRIPYFLAFIPVGPDGRAATQATLIDPFDRQYPATCWLPESGIFYQQVEVPLPNPVSEGDWWVSVSMVDVRNGYQPSVIWPDGTQDQQIGIGPFR